MADEKDTKGEKVEQKRIGPLRRSDSEASEAGTETPTQSEEPAKPKLAAGEEVEVPKKFKKLVDEVEQMSVIDLNELVKVLESKFGVSATVVAAAPAAGAGDAEAAEEKNEFSAELKSFGDNKIAVIKAVKGILGLGLKEAKDLVEGAPTMLKEGMKKEEAEELKAKIEESGGQVELK